MIGREKRVLLRHYLEQGMSKAAIARQLRISRRTVYNWMEAGELDRGVDDKAVRYRPRAPLPSKLDPFREIIRTRLADYPELSAVRLFEEVKMAGYPGGYGQVKRYVRAVRPRDPVEPVVRFETPPGHQAQVDFAEFRLPWGKRHALIVVLGYSRRMWLRFYERQTMMVVIRGIEESFPYLGGVPVELLFDQMKAVVIADGRAGGGCVWWRTRSSGASATTGASGSGPAARTGRRRRGRSNAPSATCGTTSSTAAISSPTTISTPGWGGGSTRSRTSGSTGR